MQKETLDKLRRYIDLTAAQAQASFVSPVVFRQDAGREQLWQEFVVECEQAWQELLEAVQEEQIKIRQELLEAALADPECVTAAQMDVAVALRRAFENLIGWGQG